MATIDNYKIKITVDGEDKVIDLMDSLNDLQSTLNKTATAGIAAFTALATSAVRMADGLVDLSDATGISVGKIYQLSAALEASGGQFDDADKFIKSFSNTLGQVEKGSQEAIDGLMKLGLSRSELESLSDEQLFAKAVQGLAQMEDGFAKTKLATEIFGKAAASIDFDKLAEQTSKAVDPDLERNLRLAADAVGSLEVIFRTLQTAALAAIEPILKAISELNITAESANKAIQVLGALIAAAFTASVVIQITKLVKLMKDLGNVTKAAAAAQAFLVGLSGVGLATVAASAAAATAAYVALGKAMEGAAEEKAKLDGNAEAATPAGAASAGRTVGQTPEERAVAAIKEQTRQLREKNSEANKYQRIINDTINKSQEEAAMIKAMADLDRQANNDKLEIQKQIDTELAKGADTNRTIVQELQKQLSEVDKQLAIQKQLKQEELTRLQLAQQRIDSIKLEAQIEAFNLQQRVDGAKALLSLQAANGEMTDRQARIGIQIADAQARFDAQRIKLAEDLLVAEEKRDNQAIANINKLQSMNQIRYANELRNIADTEAAEVLKAQNVIKGVEDAMTSINRAFTPYQMAQDAILQTWNKIGSAVDTFVQTGKFKFSDFAKSVIRDLAAMIVKAQIFKAISGVMGFFGVSLPGLAAGGPAKAGQPYIVGEKGPELFVPKNAGTVIPNNKMGAATEGMATGAVSAPITNNYITNNINALDAKSVAQLFAENRKTLLGSVKMAEREMPYAAR